MDRYALKPDGTMDNCGDFLVDSCAGKGADGFVELVRFVDKDGLYCVYFHAGDRGDDDFVMAPVYVGDCYEDSVKSAEVAMRLVSLIRKHGCIDRSAGLKGE